MEGNVEKVYIYIYIYINIFINIANKTGEN